MTSQIEICYEDEFILIVNKPNNILVHHSYYARNIEDDSLLQLLEQKGFDKVYPINRLDRKTSGLILLSKSKEVVAKFQKLFIENQITKKYLALVRGHILTPGTIESPVKNERGNYKEAKSVYSPIKHFELNIPVKPFPISRYTLLSFQPITGRTHQLRIHANKLAHPIIGDHKHGNRHHNKMFEEKLALPNLFLHSHQLSFLHPLTDKEINLNCELPEFWNTFFNNDLLSVTVL